MRRLLIFCLLALPLPAQISLTLNSTGLRTLTYQGRSFLATPGADILGAYYMRTPGGTVTQYFQPPCVATSDNSTYVQCVYRNGLSDSTTLRITYAVQGSNTVQATIAWTNNDSTNTLSNDLTTPFALTVGTDTISSYTPQHINLQSDASMFVLGSGWGSMALWSDYSYASLDVAVNTWTTGAQTPWLETTRTVGVSDYPGLLTTYTDWIGPGVTHTYKMWLRFGSTSDTPATLAPEAAALFAAALPPITNYPDRRRIGALFLAELSHRNANNPRGYLNDSINALDPTAFAAGLATEAATVCDVATHTMVPAAQGILIWDLEGTEFGQSFTYVGAPNRLADIAPEMDSGADTFIAALKACGLKVGMTLRPQHFLSGASLPGTCNYFATYPSYGFGYDDTFVNTTPYTFPSSTRWAGCQTAPNTYTYDGASGGGWQGSLQSLSAIQAEVTAKAQYAITRWGASFFYIDSVVYETGNAYAVDLWRNIQAAFPTILFIPEEEVLGTYSAAAPYVNPSEGVYRTSDNTRQAVPGAFGYNATNDFPTGHETEVQAGIQNGDLYASVSWFNDTTNIPPLNAAYAAAALANTSLVITDSITGRNHSFSGKPDSYTYPLMLRVYFGTSKANVLVSNTYCQKQALVSCYVNGVLQTGSSIDLSTFTWYGVTYADFTGTRMTGWSRAAF